MQFILLGYDNGGAEFPNKPLAIYQVGAQIAKVDASLTGAQLTAAIYAALGIDPAIDTLKTQWQNIMAEVATRPLANMDITQVYAWITANITDPVQAAALQTAFKNIAEELFIVRAQIAILAKALNYLFQ